MTLPVAAVAVDALGAVAGVLVVLLGVGAWWAGRARRRAAEREHEALRREEAALRRAEAAEAAGAEASALAARLEAARESGSRHDRALDTLWGLAELEHGWQRRDQAALTPGAEPTGGPGLAGALRLLVEGIREDVGIPGELVVEVAPEPSAAEAVVVFQALRILLAAVARRCDHFGIEVRADAGRLAAVLLGEGFDGGEATVEDARQVTRLLRAVGVDGSVSAEGGSLEALLAFPVPPPA